MIENLLEVKTFSGEGYKPLIDYNCWRVAYLRYIQDMHPDYIDFVEKHLDTDEVFVLMEGQAVLFLGEGDRDLTELIPVKMQPYVLYNVKQAAFHTIVMSFDATVLLVENRDTASENSAYFTLTSEQKQFIRDTAHKEMPGYWE